ncbi:DUF956 family protein [Anaerococcus sp. mt242]|uniref:DUF956 family protein n=1 Tax=unclassified Anaerococcus TaxID=2614126 RepID=UPI00193161E8|nr:DUF956 family protein [Anaerococcus sp. mt242]MBM0047023.1 DUF956 family protein [Anaerococcus sp. mt242]
MIESQNKTIDLSIKAKHLQGFTSLGDVVIGDKAFEYYNEKNPRDFIQIPRSEIELITAEVIFKTKIPRFAIHTKQNGDFIFSTVDNKKTLRAINKYIPGEKLRKSLSLLDYIKRAFKK